MNFEPNMVLKPLKTFLLTFITVVNELMAAIAIFSAIFIGIFDEKTGNYIDKKLFLG